MFTIKSLFSCILCLTTTCYAISRHPIVLFVALDGFRPDYIERGLTPALETLVKTGVRPKFMTNVFPTITTPNFFAIATGLYPEVLGVFGNQNFNENFKCLKDRSDLYEFFHYNEDIIPLWTLNEITGDDRYSATLFWPSSQVEYQKRLPVYDVQTENTTFYERVDKTIEFLTDPNYPANLVFLYFDEPDSTSHDYGPHSAEVNATLREMNNVTEYLLQKLTEHNLRDKVNLIFLSDHGMIDRLSKNTIDLDSYIQPELYSNCMGTPIAQIHPLAGFEKQIYDNLTQASQKLPNAFKVYRQDELPDRWHMKNSKRTSEIWLVAEPSYSFRTPGNNYKGDHGYDWMDELRPLFIANGPLFKSNATVEPFKNIDIFPLIVKILQLRSPPEHVKPNGTLSQIRQILKDEKCYSPATKPVAL